MITKEEILPTKTSKIRCFSLILLVIGMYTLENSPITSFISYSIFSYIIKPLFWCSIAFTIWYFPRVRPKSRIRHRSMIKWWGFNFAIIYIIISMLVGIFIEGLGKSPYAHTPKAIFLNIITVGTALVGRELVRGYLVNNLTKEENYLVFVLIALFMTITGLVFKNLINFKEYKEFIKFVAQNFTPNFTENLLATYLVFLGGPLASIIYIGIVQGFHWFSPILPDLKWITKGLIGIMCPIFFLMSMHSIYLKATKQLKKSEVDESPLMWMITSVISIGIVWFAVGVFPIYPSVIATGSMEPIIKPGDIVFVKKIKDMEDIKLLKEGDIIQFKRNTILISHRIIEIKKEDEEQIRFKTKGDNNSSPDSELVNPEDIKGKIVYCVPKAGLLTLLIKSEDEVPLEEAVF